jgi:uncharacterized membrane protein YGL010W
LYADKYYAEYHYDDCHYVLCHIVRSVISPIVKCNVIMQIAALKPNMTIFVILTVVYANFFFKIHVMLGAIMLSVIMLNAGSPPENLKNQLVRNQQQNFKVEKVNTYLHSEFGGAFLH